jgi:hypothetical protein
MKQILYTFLFLILTNNVLAKSTLQDRVDKLTTEYENLENKCISLQDSLYSVQKQIHILENELNEYKVHKSFFTNEITIVTGIFTALIAIAVFIIGFLLPRILERKQREEFKELKNSFTTIRDDILKSQKETKLLRMELDAKNARVMYYSCSDAELLDDAVVWGVRMLYYNAMVMKENNEEIVFNLVEQYTNDIKKDLKSISGHDDSGLFEYVDEFNLMCNYLIENLPQVNKEDIRYIKKEYNKIAWNEKEAE